MRKEAAAPDPADDEIRLLEEAGFSSDARRLACEMQRSDRLGGLALRIWIDHRRGAISEAVDGWRELHEALPNGNGALVRLSLLRAEESAAFRHRDLPLVRRALRFVAAGQQGRALSICAEGRTAVIASGDREQQKLLALIEALLHELAGRPGAAVAVLTALGEEPLFAQDVDRLAILARVCEQAGDRAGLEAAERVLGFLAATGILTAFPRLLQIRRTLADEHGAAAVEQAWQEAFRRRIHRLSPQERLAAAARRYIPPEALAGAALPDVVEIEDPLQRAVRLLLDGAAQEALPHLSSAPAWRAEAWLAIGDRQAAVHAATEALRTESDLPLALLLARCLGPGIEVEGEPIARARKLLHAAQLQGAADPVILRALARIEESLGRPDESAALRLRASAAARRSEPRPGVVRAAAIYNLPGREIGIVHDLIARPLRQPAREGGRPVDCEIHGELARGVRAQLRRVCAAVRETLGARFPEREASFSRRGLSLHVTKEDEPSGGPSLGLPAAIAFASALLELPVPRRFVFTGAVSYDAVALLSVRPVGGLGRKLEAALHAGAGKLVFPALQREEAFSGQVLPPAFAYEAAAPVSTFDEALALVFGAGGVAESL